MVGLALCQAIGFLSPKNLAHIQQHNALVDARSHQGAVGGPVDVENIDAPVFAITEALFVMHLLIPTPATLNIFATLGLLGVTAAQLGMVLEALEEALFFNGPDRDVGVLTAHCQ